jgi:L-threonylcarbamoyladenylate synthase
MPVLEGGASEVGIESTIVDLSRAQAGQGIFLLRPGGISALQIEAVLGQTLHGVDAEAPRVSGSLKAHYAPRTPILLLPAHLSACENNMPQAVVSAYQNWHTLHPNKKAVVVSHCPDDFNQLKQTSQIQQVEVIFKLLAHTSEAYAHDLYATLRAIDDQHVDQIFWCQPPQTADWNGVNDRLNRAAAAFSVMNNKR